jgi:hypothetical protein
MVAPGTHILWLVSCLPVRLESLLAEVQGHVQEVLSGQLNLNGDAQVVVTEHLDDGLPQLLCLSWSRVCKMYKMA